ncbi:MAG TPA: FAD-dependent oxidoreductase [Clostridiales bacterium]|nr:FAD-dependent oxidoreductase [Clostridiales bacterium]
MDYIIEPAKRIPIDNEVDICVLGGSCTGLFAAVRAARLGAKVAIVEKQNCFGGVATSGLVNIWHSLYDTLREKQIIGGLTYETIQRLNKREAIEYIGKNKTGPFVLNTEELKIELDELAKSSDIKIYFHTLYTAPYIEDGELKAVFIENKSGRKAIKAKIFIDATGDGDLCASLGVPYTIPDKKQPPTTSAKIYRLHEKLSRKDFSNLIIEYGREFGLEEDWGWAGGIPGIKELTFHAETHVFNVNCADADQLTYSEIEGRRQIRAYMDIVRKYGPDEVKPHLVALASYIGVRETRHFCCKYRLTEEDLLYGRKFNDAVANGSYRVDIHHEDKKGITLKNLDGREVYIRRGTPDVVTRWRKDDGYTNYYQIPYRCLVPNGHFDNLLVCGRMIDADKGSFGAIRVMVNLNQTGEAAGVAAYLALNNNSSVKELNTDTIRKMLKQGGSIIF